MNKNKASVAATICALLALVLSSSLAGAGPIRIATGVDSAADGYLDVAADEYGSWAVPFGGGEGPNDDHFNPVDHDLAQAAFTSGFFLFVPSIRRELLSDNADWQDQLGFSSDSSLDREVTAENVASDTNDDGVDDTLTSSFRVFRVPTLDLAFVLTQNVSSAGAGVAAIQQDYTITNNAAGTTSFTLVRTYDGDLLWDPAQDFANDEVGTGTNAGGGDRHVFQQEPDAPGVTAVTLSSPTGGAYYGGKHGVEPEGGPPAYNFGTDVQVWDAYGIPESWRNHIAGVGYDTDGLSGSTPPGATDPTDAFMGLDFEITLEPGESATVSVSHTYGQNTPADEEPCEGDANGDGTVDPLDSGFVLARFGCPVGTGDPGCDAADVNGDGEVNPLDSGFVLARFGACNGPPPPPIGACCIEGTCSETTEGTCVEGGGAYEGDGTTCDPDPCGDQKCPFPDIRTTIDGAENDPPDIQLNYDAINRSLHLYGETTFASAFSSDLASLLPELLAQVDTLESCTGLPTDEEAMATVLMDIAALSAGLTVGDIIALPPGEKHDLQARIDDLRSFGIAFPEPAATKAEAALRAEAMLIIISNAGTLTVGDLAFTAFTDVTQPELDAVELGSTTGVFAVGVCDNDKCCTLQDGEEFMYQCNAHDDKWCNLTGLNQKTCSIGSDNCP
ncbi:MAG: hypothetical protein IH988_01260 [Planctomycetes bacterium]|nr:hypothetical protein [Planctomycetota bacterium]